MNSKVDKYLQSGCGRCEYYQTPQCKAVRFNKELNVLRNIVLKEKLSEEFKWSQPCYTYEGANICIVSAYRDFVVVAFFKGALLKDTNKILVAPGKNSQASRQLRFTSVEEIVQHEDIIRAYLNEAILLEKKGAKIEFKNELEPIPDELQTIFKSNPDFRKAFFSLTKGRQRGYVLYFSQAKQSQTRINRIKKYIPTIMNGLGIHDEYRTKSKSNESS